uniref:NADH-ubiquinone oxidoreductase chain 1 n=1 Tax=Glaucocystis nostochinearum TaxID=38271 RepID=E9P6C9_9EUKA|nr:NADH dehydrogenase subunit 1 [Glaucocystis nostochinearum]ADW83113.1 NADH dehydrogenase subunit 1 [Glaucocystis nostochinearum]
MINYFFYLIKIIASSFSIILPLLIGVAYLTLAERKVMASMQQRKGPNIVGIFGLLQPLADGLKLLTKETILPNSANTFIFILAPILTFVLSLMGWAVIPFDWNVMFSNLNVGILYLLAISSLGVYGIIMSGWSSNSKYAFLGGLRSAAQMISYEISIGLIIVTIVLCVGSLNLNKIIFAQKDIWFFIPHFPIFIIFFISVLAETNRAPFDLPEAEAELVAGYNVEYSAMGFALFFLGEYANILLMSALTTILFLGGWWAPFSFPLFLWIPGFIWFGIKATFVTFAFIWVRAAYPRYRYDQLMYLGWKVFLPICLAWLFFISGILVGFDGLPAVPSYSISKPY